LKAVLLSHPWPGNVRELRNALERALLLGDGVLDPADLFLQQQGPALGADMLPFPAPMATIEIEAARRMVQLFDGNKSAAAEALAISRSRLYRLLDGKTDEGGNPGESDG
jgi:two-component system NtrC family response regulator